MSEVALTEAQVHERLALELPQWTFRDGWIRRDYRTGGWKSTMMAVAAVGHLAEAAWHHPDLSVSFARLTVKLCTHSAKGITDKDFALAARIEQLLMWRPQDEPGAVLEGTPDEPRWRHLVHD